MSYKSKQIFFVLVKLIVVIGAFYLIYIKVFNDDKLNFQSFKNTLEQTRWHLLPSLLVLILFSLVNWTLEILKWQNLANTLRSITFFESLKQSLFSLTASLITPNRIGEYGAKALFFNKSQTKKCLVLNLIGNLSQLAVTIFFGMIGCFFIWQNHPSFLETTKVLNYLFAFIFLILTGCGIWFYYKKFKSIPFQTYPKALVLKTLGLSLSRYVVFNIQFYVLLVLFNFPIDIFTALTFTSSMYLLASIIPAISLFDVVIKGSISVYLFGLLGYNAITILSIVLVMWILNFAIPASIGSYFVLTFKQKNILNA